MLNVIDRRREGALVNVEDALLNFLRAHARVLPNHGDDGNVDVWKNVRRSAQ